MKLALALAGLALALLPAAPPGSACTILFGAPLRNGDHTLSIRISYQDAQGRNLEKTITASTALSKDYTAQDVRALVQAKLLAAFNDSANAVKGHPLGNADGTGNAMAIAPAPDAAGRFSNAAIERIEIVDGSSAGLDSLTPPTEPALARIQALGDITGSDGVGASRFDLRTDQGTVSVDLRAGMRKSTLLRELASGLQAQGTTAWVDTEELVLFVYLVERGDVGPSIAAGSTDEGLVARAAVLNAD